TIEANFNEANTRKEVQSAVDELEDNQGVVIFMAKRGMASYFPQMNNIPSILNAGFLNRNYLLIYPYQGSSEEYAERRSLSNHGDFVEIGKIVRKLFKQ